jgi:carboxylesterase type B
MEQVLPVMVYIHGGAFAFSSGDIYGAKYFMDQSVLLITFNYRLGALGWLLLEPKVLRRIYELFFLYI